IAKHGSIAGNAGRTQFSPRNSRVSFGVNAPAEDGWQSKGYLEFDLLGYNPPPGNNTESAFYTNPTLRLRHAYIQTDKNGWKFLAGQAWSLFGWQPYYNVSTVTLPPVSGVLYERALQATVVKSFKVGDQQNLEIGMSVVRPVERDSQYPGMDVGTRLSY